MSRRVWIAALSVGSLLHAAAPCAQGFVREAGPRRALSLDVPTPRCELWRGDIHGNDPTASITVRLCTEGSRVTGTFAWSSDESGSDRRSLEGAWSADGAVLTARDTAMLEATPRHGWTLCTADSYALRRVSPDRLEGTYVSSRCNDRGNLAMVRVPDAPAKPAETASAPAAAVIPPAVLSTHHTRASAGCSASPGPGGASSSWAVVGAVALCAAMARRRGDVKKAA